MRTRTTFIKPTAREIYCRYLTTCEYEIRIIVAKNKNIIEISKPKGTYMSTVSIDCAACVRCGKMQFVLLGQYYII